MLKLTRKQELQLIDLGLEKLLERTLSTSKSVKMKNNEPKKRKWTNAQRRAFSLTMKKKWAERRSNIRK
jgi:hypothetical protein